MISNILVSCLIPDKKKRIAESLSFKLDMIYADVDEMIKYAISNPQEVINKVGIEYLQKLTEKEIANIASYQNTVITADEESTLNFQTLSVLKTTSLVVYIQIPFHKYKKYISKKNHGILQPIDIINLNMFYDRQTIMIKNANSISSIY